jgi:protein TonB
MLECNHMKSSSRPLDFFLALLLNTTILVGPVFAGLYFTDTIDLKKFETTFLITPPPPPPPPPAPAAVVTKAAPVHRVFEHAGKLIAPIAVPQHIADIKEAPIPEVDLGGGVPGGVPGGVAGGSMGGVIGGVIGGVTTAVPAPIVPEQAKPRAPMRVVGNIRPPKLMVHVEPQYPALARQAHIQGVVTIDAILDENGNVIEMKVVSGPPLLYQAALEALGKWKYEPVYLNDRPIAVELLVNVTFELKQH